MSGQSAKRLGIEVTDNLELESRLRRIEVALEKKSNTNDDSDNQSRGKGAVPQVTGLRVIGQIPGGAQIGWNAVSISDLRRYELNFSTSFGFSENLQAFNEATTQYTFSSASDTGGGGGATWFARVRAVNSSGQKGVWSVVLNLTTGQAQTADLAAGSVTIEQISTEPGDIPPASSISYDGSGSGLSADNVQDAIDEVVTGIPDPPFTEEFVSTTQTITGGGTLTLAHGLSGTPKIVHATLINVTAEHGYVTGDEIFIGNFFNSSNQGYICKRDATNLLIQFASGAAVFNVPRDTDGASQNLTDANWTITFMAWR